MFCRQQCQTVQDRMCSTKYEPQCQQGSEKKCDTVTETVNEQVEEKKWQLRGEALDKLLELVKAPKIQPGDFGDLTRVLKKFISKDTNVMLVTKVLLDHFQMIWLSKF